MGRRRTGAAAWRSASASPAGTSKRICWRQGLTQSSSQLNLSRVPLFNKLGKNQAPDASGLRLAEKWTSVSPWLEGYDFEFCGLLDKDADGMGLWKCGRAWQTLLATS